MQRVCWPREITATTSVRHKNSEESRQVVILSEPSALTAIIRLVTNSARYGFTMSATRIECGATYALQSALFPFPRDLVMGNSLCQPGGAQ